MLNIFKKKPRITKDDLDELINCTDNPKYHHFIVPKRLETQMKWAIGKPFCMCLWWEKYKGYSIQPCYIEVYNDPNELSFIRPNGIRPHTTCR